MSRINKIISAIYGDGREPDLSTEFVILREKFGADLDIVNLNSKCAIELYVNLELH